MNRKSLKVKLDLLGVKRTQYCVDGGLNFDCIILFSNYNMWEVFYLDERGGRNDEKCFTTENEACEYVYRIFKDAKEIESKFM